MVCCVVCGGVDIFWGGVVVLFVWVGYLVIVIFLIKRMVGIINICLRSVCY